MLQSAKLSIGNMVFEWGNKTYLMGILNLTPDSFSGDGLYINNDQDHAGDNSANLIEATLAQARDFVKAGADILDVGGESTRPGATLVNIDTELKRVVPVIQSLVREFEIPISVDTYKHQVAQAALEAGANMVNDVWGLNADSEMASTIAKHEAPVILMHNCSSWAHADIKDRLGGHYIGIPYVKWIAF